MTRFSKTIRAAGLAATAAIAAVAAPSSAQVQGNIATADVNSAILGTTAFQTAYNQIGTTYSAQLQQLQTKQQELATVLQPFDTNGDGQLQETELAGVQNSPSFTQIQTLEQEIAGLNGQVNGARIFAVEQILARYPEALSEVVEQRQVAVLLAPDSVQFIGEGGDISRLVAASLNTKVPSVQIVPPAEWRPSRQGAQVTQNIQNALVNLRRQQAAQQQAEQPAAAPAGR